MKTRLSVALTLLATVACGGGNGVTGPRVTPDNVVEVTLEQAAETLPEIAALVTERTAPLAAALEAVPECPERQESPFEMRFGGPADPTDARAWDNYGALIGSCRAGSTNLDFTARRVESIRTVYETEYVETTLARIRERVTPERLERNAVSLERLAEANFPARWSQLHYIAYQRVYGFRRAGMLDPGTWPDVDQARVERTLDTMAEQIDNRVFDMRDAGNDATDLYERMVAGEHR